MNMVIRKKLSFGGLGTIFSLIVVYFIYKYSDSQGWGVLVFIAKWYLIIVGGFIALSLGIVLLVLLFSLIMFIAALFRIKSLQRKSKKKAKNFIEAEYEVKE